MYFLVNTTKMYLNKKSIHMYRRYKAYSWSF